MYVVCMCVIYFDIFNIILLILLFTFYLVKYFE